MMRGFDRTSLPDPLPSRTQAVAGLTILSLFAVAGAAAVLVGMAFAFREVQYASRALTAQAVVVSVSQQQVSGGRGGGRTTVYLPVFEFTDSRGTAQTLRVEHGAWNWNFLVGATITVEYDPVGPRDVRPLGTRYWMMPIGLGGVGLLWLIIVGPRVVRLYRCLAAKNSAATDAPSD